MMDRKPTSAELMDDLPPMGLLGSQAPACKPTSAAASHHPAPAQPAGANVPAKPLEVREIIVRTGRLVCEVVVANPRLRTTTPELIERVSRDHPHLAQHACVNAEGPLFGAVMDHTSLPHLLEHVAIDLQTQASSDPAAVFVGTTEWLDRAAGVARIQLSFADDLEGLRAFRDSVEYLNSIVLP